MKFLPYASVPGMLTSSQSYLQAVEVVSKAEAAAAVPNGTGNLSSKKRSFLAAFSDSNAIIEGENFNNFSNL